MRHKDLAGNVTDYVIAEDPIHFRRILKTARTVGIWNTSQSCRVEESRVHELSQHPKHLITLSGTVGFRQNFLTLNFLSSQPKIHLLIHKTNYI